MLLYINNSKRTLKSFTNGGRQDSSQLGESPDLFTVWYNSCSMIYYILAWSDTSCKFHLTTDTIVGRYIAIDLSPNWKMIFEELGSGLYLFRNQGQTQVSKGVSRYLYLMLTKVNLSDFTKHEITAAQKAWEFYRAIGFPGYKKLFWLLQRIIDRGEELGGGGGGG